MSKYCMQCGKKIDDNDMHCQFCGASQDTGFDNNLKPTNKKKKNDLIVPIVAICSIILIILIVVANLTIFNNGYKKPIEKLFDAFESGDIDDLEDALPEWFIDSDDFDKKSLKKSLSLLADNDIELDYEEDKKEEIDDDELEKQEKNINKHYDENVDIDKGYNVTVNVLMSIKDNEISNNMNFKVYRIDGKWYLTHISLPDIL